ncbi:RNA polymerase subunit sigma-70 [Nocardia sp. NEAU-G5]|uniref:RNA polymerase subunit sigma-70 n=1 Tax=Nocardia albiluteola TaxID=2842303 RepID=A0ABS6B4V2_9NOCA|nr:RNA polymerase subunit sigma-70 [Nocardia albiluteola]MBU3064390.1 RNA polymerase subunit sigma-70 [Nocardia albiluteola]
MRPQTSGRIEGASWSCGIPSNARARRWRCPTSRSSTRKRRPLPSGLTAAETVGASAANPERGIPWLQPAPDSILHAATGDPASVVSHRSTIRLAFIAALQHLSARQRAALVLRDVLGWRASEVATMLDTTTAAVNSALQRARTQLAAAGPVPDELSEPDEPGIRTLLDRYAAAFEHADVRGLAELLRAEVEFGMPPVPAWYSGREAVCEFLADNVLRTPGRWRMVPIRANESPAFAVYEREPDDTYRLFCIQVLSVVEGGVARVVTFLAPGRPERFGIPETFTAAGRSD